MNDLLKVEQIGSGEPKIALVACTHGDEIIGLIIFNAIRAISSELLKPITLITANLRALELNKRFIDSDLNRVFPGIADGDREERLAFFLNTELNKYDIVIDIHGTNSNIDALVITTDMKVSKLEILSKLSIDKVMLASKEIFGGHEIISNVKCGLALEYGPDKSGDSWPIAWSHIKQLLINLEYLSGQTTNYSGKDLYRVYNKYEAPENFVQNEGIDDFKLIKKGDEIGTIDGNIVYANEDFYPIFVGKGSYSKIFALMATKEELNLEI